jgi:hypothetical protein
MDRSIFFAGAIPRSSDVLFGQQAAMVGLAALSKAVLGSATVVDGLTVGPNSPAALNVVVAPGSIYSLANLDATAYGALAADTTHSILKQGVALDTTVLSIAPPGTAGFSQVFLIQAQFQETDSVPVTLPYYNAANPSVPFSGPANSGTPQNTRRLGTVVVQTKAGTAATTGTQTTPSADAGWTALAAVTVANGATTIIAGNITAILGANADPTATGLGLRSGRLLNTQTFTANGTYTPTPGMVACVIEVQGGGGAGGGAGGATSTNVSLGAPGASGSYAKGKFTAADIGASKAVTVGAGGAGVSAAAGGNGGTSSVGSLISSPGGPGGGILTNQASPTINGNGTFATAPTGGNIIAIQGAGQVASIAVTQNIVAAAPGGPSFFGAGGTGVAVNTTGVAATNPGAGGGASAVNSSGGNSTGGAGFRGVVIIWEYS